MTGMPHPVMRGMLAATGTAAACLGALGLFVPLLPTTPFLLLSAYCFSKSSPALHRWLVNNRHLGPYLERYRPGRRLSARDLGLALAVLWVSIVGSALLAMPHPAGKAGLLVVAACVSAYLVRRYRGIPPADISRAGKT